MTPNGATAEELVTEALDASRAIAPPPPSPPLSAEAAALGDRVTAPDAWTGATLAHAAVSAALGLLRSNLAMLSDTTLAHAAQDEARALQHRANDLLDATRVAVRHVAG